MSEESAENFLWGHWSGLALSVALGTTVVDQAHKWYMLGPYDLISRGRVYIAPFLDLVFHKNTGISYSLLDGDSYRWQLALAAFSILVCAGLWVWIARSSTSRLMTWSLALIIGGAFGNAIDRVLIGGVADYISLHAYGFYWYVFNIADCAIVAGVAGLLYDGLAAES